MSKAGVVMLEINGDLRTYATGNEEIGCKLLIYTALPRRFTLVFQMRQTEAVGYGLPRVFWPAEGLAFLVPSVNFGSPVWYQGCTLLICGHLLEQCMTGTTACARACLEMGPLFPPRTKATGCTACKQYVQ